MKRESHRIASRRRTTNVRIKVAVLPPLRERERERGRLLAASELLRSRRQASTLSPANFTVETRPGTFRRAAFPPSTLPSTFALFPTPTFPTNVVPSNWENFQGHSMERRISNVITDRFLLVCLGIDPGYLAPRRYQ